MDVHEALAKAEYGDVVESEHGDVRITKGRVGSIKDDNGGNINNSFTEKIKWHIKPKSFKVEVTIDGEQFQISKESAKSFKESINNVKL